MEKATPLGVASEQNALVLQVGGCAEGYPPTHTKNYLGQDTLHKPRNQECLRWNRKRQRTTDFSFGTWNVRSLYRPGSAQNLTKELERYHLKVVALQEIRWKGTGSVKMNTGSILYGDCGERHELGTGFYVHDSIMKAVKEFKSINNRISYITIAGRSSDISFINGHAPCEDKEDFIKEEFYAELDNVYNSVPNHNVKIVLGDFNAKVGQENIYKSVIGNASLHQESSDNGIHLISFATGNNLCIVSTRFHRKDIHKGTWMAPDGHTVNQIDHVCIQKRYANSIIDTRTYRGADCDSDHFLVISKMNIKYKKVGRTAKKTAPYDTNRLKETEVRRMYESTVAGSLMRCDELAGASDVNSDWSQIKETVNSAASEILGKRKRSDKVWFNQLCQQKVEERRLARKMWLENLRDHNLREKYTRIRKETATILRQEKRKYYKELIEEAEEDYIHHRTRQMFQKVKKITQKYKKRETFIKDTQGKILTSDSDIEQRWADYFANLLNCADPTEPLLCDVPDTVDTEVEPPSEEEIQGIIKHLKNNKASGEDKIVGELIKNGGPELVKRITKLIRKVWEYEKMPDDWKTAVICPIFKKNDPLDCDNYRGISLLNVTYKILSQCLLRRVMPLAEEIIGDYQCGFRRDRSTSDHLFTLRQITEKAWEYNVEIHMVFVDFRKAYDSIHRSTITNVLKEFQFPGKLIRLIQMCLEETYCKVKTNTGESKKFEVRTGLRQGDALSPILFNLVLEKIDREHQKLNPAGIRIGSNEIYRLAYADDIVLISDKKEKLQLMTSSYRKIARKAGLEINEKKTEYMVVSKTPNDGSPLTVDGLTFKRVDTFKYLGSILSEQNKMEIEIKARLTAANKAYFGLRDVLCSRAVSRTFKLRLYQTVILPVALYGSESFTFRKADEQKLLVFERKILRKIFGPKRDPDTQEWRILKNQELKELYQQADISQRMKRRRLMWAGHLIRMEEERLPKVAFSGSIEGRRHRGRPRTRWKDDIDKDAVTMGLRTGEWTSTARNREIWKRSVENAYGLQGPSDN